METCLTEKKISADISVPVEAGGMICSSFSPLSSPNYARLESATFACAS